VRILVLAQQWFPDYIGGTARVVQSTAVALAARGHDVVVIAPASDAEPAVSTSGRLQIRRTMRRGPLPQSVTDAYEVQRSVRALQSRTFDVVLAHHAVSAAGALRMKGRPPLAFVFHASPLLESRYRRANKITFAERLRARSVEPALAAFEGRTLQAADRILVLSRFSQGVVEGLNPALGPRVRVVGGGVDTERFRPAAHRAALRTELGVTDSARVIVTARRLVSRMGVDVLLDAFATLGPGARNLKLVVIGDGELRQSLEAKRDALQLTNHVVFRGRVSDSDLVKWYQVADLFVLPTLAYEGFGMVTAEALACGTPVVATRVGASAELLADLNPDLLAAPTSDALATAIHGALAEGSDAVRAACATYANRQFGWSSVITAWEAALADIIGGTRRTS
jgi:glycosyltransferase involved in cell wall biosynthesis